MTSPILIVFCCICVGCFSLSGLALLVNNIQTIIHERAREKREKEQALREVEYHQRRMKDLK